VELLQEEMRRVLTFMDWQANWWLAQGTRWQSVADDQVEGLLAYASHQAAIRTALQSHFRQMWRHVPTYIQEGAIPNELQGTIDVDGDAPDNGLFMLPNPHVPNP
jgi:hypothetical protein